MNLDSSLIDPVLDPEPAHPIVHRVPVSVVQNMDAWRSYYTSLGCKNRAMREDADRKAAMIFRSIHISDRGVLRSLHALAYRCPRTPIRDELLRRVECCMASTRRETIRGQTVEVIEKEALTALMSLKGPDLTKDGCTEKDFWDYQLVKLLAKYPFAGCEAEAKLNALIAFVEAEIHNSEVNLRIETEWTSNHELANELRGKVRDLLGSAPTPEELLSLGTWGPGTTEGYPYPSSMTGAEFKYNAPLTMTPGVYPIAALMLPHYQSWYSHLKESYGPEWVRMVCGNTLKTVPKKHLLDRTMAAEPLFNSWVQLALGAVIRKRLQRFGFDLDTMWVINQQLAHKASLTGLYATVDFKDASNRHAYRMVEALVEPQWFELLKAARSPKMFLPVELTSLGFTSPRKLEMFSSMGNGYTFELETVLFLSAALVATNKSTNLFRRREDWLNQGISVFGDDVILPTWAFQGLSEISAEVGWEINEEKSFSVGPFRESCGRDLYAGVDIHPVQIKERLNRGSDVVDLANRIRSHAHRLSDEPDYTGFGSDRWAGLWASIVSHIPIAIRELVATPPFVTGGLWSTFGSEYCSDLKGKPITWKVIVEKSNQIDLTSHLFEYKNRRGEYVGWVGNSSNLLIARIGPSVDVTKEWKHSDQRVVYRDPTMVGAGELSTLRFRTHCRVVLSGMSASSRWLGWRPLYSDFS